MTFNSVNRFNWTFNWISLNTNCFLWETIENHSLSLHLTGLFEWRLIDFLIILSSIICKNKIIKMKMKNMCMVQNLQIHTILLLAMTWLPQLKYLKKHPQFQVLILYFSCSFINSSFFANFRKNWTKITFRQIEKLLLNNQIGNESVNIEHNFNCTIFSFSWNIKSIF